ncbi:3-oxoacyl-[acyl-carrier-protein] synthase 2 [bacterium BMS3Bbin10]|nr:3-oxoacyl-[acyl-carrier-protein] synthase 2 [bacterium BMS3Bbin10]
MTGNLRDKKGRPVIVVTGFGIVTSLGRGMADNWAALTAGRSGIHPITRFSTEGLSTKIAGTIDGLEIGDISAPGLAKAFATASIAEAISQSGIGSSGSFPGPLFLATPPAEVEWPLRRQIYECARNGSPVSNAQMKRAAREGAYQDQHALFLFGQVGEYLADKFGTLGQPISLSTACASGGTAIQLGVEAIRRGETDAALCVGTDGSVHTESLIRFSLLSALSTRNDPPKKASRPFAKDRDGFVMAEGSAALVLESYDAAKARGAKILGVLRGCGERADDFHRTRSTPDGTPIIGAIRNALDDAGVEPRQIDYINAHGTSTPENDKIEYISLANVFGEHLAGTPISSNKSIVGHTLTAAGAVEAAFSLMTIATGTIPPTINYDTPDPEMPLDVVPNEKRDSSVEIVLSNSFGFGGQNVCLVLSAEPA